MCPTRQFLLLALCLATLFAHASEPVITPPSLARMPSAEELRVCYPVFARDHVQELQLTAILTIDATGEITAVRVPAGAEPWMQRTAKCAAALLVVNPGTLDGVPVESEASVPLRLSLVGRGEAMPATTRPTVSTASDQVLDIYRKCYPADLDTEARIVYKLRITVRGLPSHPEVLTSSGDERLDEAGACILRKLRFEPARRNGVPIDMTLDWPILVRPPPEA